MKTLPLIFLGLYYPDLCLQSLLKLLDKAEDWQIHGYDNAPN